MTRDEKDRTPAGAPVPPEAQHRREILSLPPDQALDAILDAPDPAGLVRSFAEEDFFFLLHGIGPEDCPTLLALATSRQWEHLLDLEAWRRDRFDPAAAERWLHLMEKAAGPRLARWLLYRKKDLLDLLLNRTLEIRVREHDQDPSEFGDAFFSIDDVYHVRVIPLPGPAETAAQRSADLETRMARLLERIAETDHVLYQKALLDAAGLLPAEAEEEAYRLRNVRLAEKGFAPPDEAVGIYQGLKPEALFQRTRKHLLRESVPDAALPVPRFADGRFDARGLFARALSEVGASTGMLQLQQEFAGLCNRLIAADQTPVGEREALQAVVEKAAGFLTAALEHLTEGKEGPRAAAAARLIETYPLIDLFRVGHGLALSLKWRAGRWKKESWFEGEAALPLTFWDEEWVGVLGGLLLPRPRYFDNYRTGSGAYRDFASLKDLQRTEAVLEQMMRTDRLLSRMGIDSSGPRPRGLTYKNFLLTLWAGEASGGGGPGRPPPLVPPLSVDALKGFHRRLFPEPAPEDAARPRRIADSLKEEFAAWLSRQTGMDPADIGEQIGPTLEALFSELEEEVGAVAEEDLDPRYLRLFLVTTREAGSG